MSNMNKRGDYTDHILGILIAVACLVLLAVLAVSIYKTIVANEYNSAKNVLNKIENKINSIDSGETTTLSIQSPCKESVTDCAWRIVGFTSSDRYKPDRCYFSSCLCLCKVEDTFLAGGIGEDIKSKCQDSSTGICKEVNFEEIKFYSQFRERDYPPQGVRIIYMKEPLLNFIISLEGSVLNINQTVLTSK